MLHTPSALAWLQLLYGPAALAIGADSIPTEHKTGGGNESTKHLDSVVIVNLRRDGQAQLEPWPRRYG